MIVKNNGKKANIFACIGSAGAGFNFCWTHIEAPINIVQKYIKKYENEKIVIKYGGNVLIDRNVFNNFISDINVLSRLGLSVVVVHGGCLLYTSDAADE